jgi:protein-S-isoprenylcysteine O-methyltransferase Ste14
MDEASKRQGTALVAAQFTLMAVLAALAALGLALTGEGHAGRSAWVVAAGAALVAAAVVGAAALAANRPGNFNIRPLPRAGGQLVTQGIYGWIRHPMYTSVLLGGLACVFLAPLAGSGAALTAALAWAALASVLWIKSGVEERWMGEAHPGYADYRRRTRRFVPGVF